MRKYDAYKDSGVDWLGEIPVGWEVKPIYATSELSRDSISADDLDDKLTQHYSIPNIQEFNGPVVEDGKTIASNKYLVKGGEILFSKLNPRKGTVLIAEEHNELAVASTEFVILDVHDGETKYLYYVLSSEKFREFVSSAVESVTRSHQRVNPSLIYKARVPFPNITTQTNIARYLDQKVAALDALIADKRRLLELYEEEKTALINRAVTRGLDESVALKDSGVDWLGEVPEGWEVVRLKYLLAESKGALKTGPFGSQIKTNDYQQSGNYKVYTQRNVLDDDFSSGRTYITDVKFNDLIGFEIFPDDIVFTTRGTIGRCTQVPKGITPGVLHPCLIRVQLDYSKVLPEWLMLYVNDTSFFLENVKMQSNSTVIDVIYGGTLSEISVPLPSIDDQRKVLSSINSTIMTFNNRIESLELHITLLTEYRTALISEAVTGKIKIEDNTHA